MGNFITGRLPSRAVLDEFRPCLADVDRGTTPAARAFVVLDAAVTAHVQALDYLVHDVGGESNCPRFFDRSRCLKSRLFLG
ncbi:hypothetical protein D3273_15615 [Lichenibacterium minor]|uniref:Uncharacterized protein n=1 Tax=Lichenibacterium minor TaxID=2316528 RepID=A0A4Q2U3P6_9HYPH|nr:hypothetical protein [Lichenibacterium minor]RYC31133.1 hypothetical protein D3273_15615 [Lichenibacterium minor]